MKVSELARAAEVSADTVRFYTRAGLLHPTRDPGNGYQRFAPNDLQRLKFARKARQLGFSLKEVTAILRDADKHRSPCPHVRDLFAQKLAAVEQQLAELTELRERMRAATEQWQQMPDGAPDGHTICRLIEHWDNPLATGIELKADSYAKKHRTNSVAAVTSPVSSIKRSSVKKIVDKKDFVAGNAVKENLPQTPGKSIKQKTKTRKGAEHCDD